jgi:hypothetical protein
MDAAEIVEHEVECHGVRMVLDFLEKAFVSRVNRRIIMRIVRFDRST